MVGLSDDLEITDADREIIFDLVQHPGWPAVKKVAEVNAKKRADGLARFLLHTETEIDLMKLQHDRGYWKAVTDFPGRMERAARKRREE